MKEMFYLTTDLVHFISRYMASVKDHLNSERGNPLPPLYGLLFPLINMRCFICTRQDNTYQDFCYASLDVLAGTRNTYWVHHEGSIRRPTASTTELHIAPDERMKGSVLFNDTNGTFYLPVLTCGKGPLRL